MSVTHIAGPVVTIGQRKIQRCAVCGEKLVDNLHELQGRIAVASTRETGAALTSFWGPLHLVNHDGNRWSDVSHEDGDQLPDDACIDLVEDE